jgi:hypothetical protein
MTFACETSAAADMPRWVPETSIPMVDAEDARPILGGDTAITLTAASVLQSLGVTVAPLGSAAIDTNGDDPVARFAITGGTDGPEPGSSVVLHQGSGLELSNNAGTIELHDFRIDTQNSTVRSNVTVNGVAVGNVAVFDIGAGGSLTLTAAAAEAVSTTLDLPAITSEIPIGTAAPMAIVDPERIWDYCALDTGMQFLISPGTQPIVGGETKVTLTAAATLQSLHVEVSPLGSAAVDAEGADPVAAFPITGGTLGPSEGDAVILHQGSGLQLADSDSTVALRDFLIDTQNHVVDANVTVDDLSLGNVAVFSIGEGDALLLTPAAAGVLSTAFGTSAITAGLEIGMAAPSPATWSMCRDM